MKIALGSDHGGFELKETIKDYLIKEGYEVEDVGTVNQESCDYPIYGEQAAEAVIFGECDQGIVVCGTGIGISLAANKVPGIRCALCTNEFMAAMAREHNNANVLALGARVIGDGLALEIVKVFLNTNFAGGRHERRVNLIHDIEKKYIKNRK
jgi:ribose 5-phosphate isomerase B